MEDTELRQKLDALEKRLDATYVSAEKTRKYFLAVIVVSVVAFVLPLLGLVFAIPALLSGYADLGAI
ncbi:MAG: hypothetical protein AAB790_00465 [Patescibacteria group bacterium]